MSKLLHCLKNKNNPGVWNQSVADTLIVTPMSDDTHIIVSSRPVGAADPTLEREANHSIVNKKTMKFVCRPHNGGDTLVDPHSPVTIAQKLSTGIFVYMYSMNGEWKFVSPSVNAAVIQTALENMPPFPPRSANYTYCFELRGDLDVLVNKGGHPPALFLFTARHNLTGAYVNVHTNENFSKFSLRCELLPLVVPGGTSRGPGGPGTLVAGDPHWESASTPGHWGCYIQSMNDTQGNVVSKNKKKTRLFLQGTTFHVVYRILTQTMDALDQDISNRIPIDNNNYSPGQLEVYKTLSVNFGKLLAHHKRKLESIRKGTPLEEIIAENSNDRYVVDMYLSGASPTEYYTLLFPIYAPQFEKGNRIAWLLDLLELFNEGELDAPEVHEYPVLTDAEIGAIVKKNKALLAPPPVVAPTPAPVVAPAVAPVAPSTAPSTSPTAAPQTAAERMAARRAVQLAAQVQAQAPPVQKPTPQAPQALGGATTSKRPDVHVKQTEYVARTNTDSGRSRASLIIKQPKRL